MDSRFVCGQNSLLLTQFNTYCKARFDLEIGELFVCIRLKAVITQKTFTLHVFGWEQDRP